MICKSYVTPTFFILDTFRWCMFYPLDIIYTTCVQNGLVRNDSDISRWTCNLYQLSVWRLYGAFERELIHPEISFCEINFCVYWFLGISRFIGKSAKICLHQIYFIFLPMQINLFKVFAEFVISRSFKLILTILTRKNCVTLNSVWESLLACFWPFSYVYVYTIN